MPGTPPTPPTRVECVMIAGCSMRDSGAPRDAASAKTRVRVVSSIAASSVATWKERTPPTPAGFWARASS